MITQVLHCPYCHGTDRAAFAHLIDDWRGILV